MVSIGTRQGGEATTDEMCISFLFYYPRMPLDGCLADPVFDTFPEIQNKTVPEKLKFFDGYDWEDRHARLLYRQNIEKTKYRASCYARRPSFVSWAVSWNCQYNNITSTTNAYVMYINTHNPIRLLLYDKNIDNLPNLWLVRGSYFTFWKYVNLYPSIRTASIT